MRTTVGLLVMVGALGCSAAFQAAREGQLALDRGDVEAAARHYYSACRQSEDKDWCERADRLYADVKETLIAEAKPVCGQPGQERKCFDILNRARRVKDDPQLATLADLSGATWLASCRKTQVTTPVDAVLRVRCVETMRSDVSTMAYGQQLAAERKAMAEFVSAQAKTAADQRLIGNAFGLSTLARCLSDELPPSLSLEATRRQLISNLVVKTQVATDGLADAPGICSMLQKRSNERLECVSTASELGLRVGLTGSQVSHDFTDTVHDVTYVARREVYQNPEWHRLEGIRQQLERNARAAQKNAALAKDDCEIAQNDLRRAKYCQNCEARRNEEAYCKRASTMDDFRRAANRDLDDAESNLRMTKRELVNEITDVYRYTERVHTWRQNFRVVIASSNPALPGRDFTIEASRTSIDRPDFPPAGIEGRVARAPSQADLDAQGADELHDALAEWIKQSTTTLANTKEAACARTSGDAPKLECRMGAAFLRGEEPGRFYVTELGKVADAKAAYPAAPCMP